MTTSEIIAWGRGAPPAARGSAGLVALDPRSLSAHGFSSADVTHAPVGAVLVAWDGTHLVVTPEGALDPWPPLGYRSIASDPAARAVGTRSSAVARRRGVSGR